MPGRRFSRSNLWTAFHEADLADPKLPRSGLRGPVGGSRQRVARFTSSRRTLPSRSRLVRTNPLAVPSVQIPSFPDRDFAGPSADHVSGSHVLRPVGAHYRREADL